jgi:microcompartment protein CcmL/EutN
MRQVMTGVDIQDPGGVAALTGNSGYEDAGPALQITVPGPSDAVVEVKLYGRDGQKALPSGGVVTAKAGSVMEVSLAGVPAGQYTVSVASDVSIVAAARITRGTQEGQPSDVAWAPSGVRLGSQHVVPVPQGGVRQLVFGALDTRATITYAAITADGKVRAPSTADIAGGTTASIAVPDKADDADVVGYVVSASGDAAFGAVLLQQDGRNDVASLAFQPAAAGQETVPVTISY